MEQKQCCGIVWLGDGLGLFVAFLLGLLGISIDGIGGLPGCDNNLGCQSMAIQVEINLVPPMPPQKPEDVIMDASGTIIAQPGASVTVKADAAGGKPGVSGSEDGYEYEWGWGAEENYGYAGSNKFTVTPTPEEIDMTYTIYVKVKDAKGVYAKAEKKLLVKGTGTTPNPDPDPTPTANPQSVSTAYETKAPVVLTGSPNGVTYLVVTNPGHGTLDGGAPNLTFTPNDGYSGPDSFTFKVTNGKVDSAPATVSITVGAPANPPQGSATVSLTAFPTVGGAPGDTTLNANVGNRPTGVSETGFNWDTDGGVVLKGAGTNSLSMRYTPGQTIHPRTTAVMSDGSEPVSDPKFEYVVQ